MTDQHTAEIVGPFKSHDLVVDGWTVPLVEATELDGGRVFFTIDRRFGFEICAADFDEAAHMLAHAIAIALGLPCHPRGDLTDDERTRHFQHLTHFALRPVRTMEIGAVQTEEVDDADDPRND